MSAECFMQHYQVVDLFIFIIFIYGLPLHIVCNFSLSLSIISTHTLYRSVSPVIQMGFCYCKPATSLCLCNTYLMSSAICLWAFEKTTKWWISIFKAKFTLICFHFWTMNFHLSLVVFVSYSFLFCWLVLLLFFYI